MLTIIMIIIIIIIIIIIMRRAQGPAICTAMKFRDLS